MTKAATRQAGQQAEQQALDYLQGQGLSCITRNWSCKGGELDLVMLDSDTVVFAEVRYRMHAGWGGALASVDERKRAKLVIAAQSFLQAHERWAAHPCRFDIIALEGSASPSARINWLKNAFDS